MIPYEDLVRALDRHRRRQAGEQVEDEMSAFPAGVDVDIEPDMTTEPQEILDGDAFAEPVEVGDITDETALPTDHVDGEYIEPADGEMAQEHLPAELPPDDPNAQEGEGSGTIYGMPAAPPPPPDDDPNRQQ